jgi:hypothetical protein
MGALMAQDAPCGRISYEAEKTGGTVRVWLRVDALQAL